MQHANEQHEQQADGWHKQWMCRPTSATQGARRESRGSVDRDRERQGN